MESLPKTETLLYGVKDGDEDWQTVILSSQPAYFDRVRVLATKDGYGRFRVVTIDLSKPPDFSKTVR